MKRTKGTRRGQGGKRQKEERGRREKEIGEGEKNISFFSKIYFSNICLHWYLQWS